VQLLAEEEEAASEFHQLLAERLERDLLLSKGSSWEADAGDDLDLEFSLQDMLPESAIQERRASSQFASSSLSPAHSASQQQRSPQQQRQKSSGIRTQLQEPQQQQRSHSAAPRRNHLRRSFNDRELTKAISASQTLGELESLLEAHSARFNHLHVSCMINRLAKVGAWSQACIMHLPATSCMSQSTSAQMLVYHVSSSSFVYQ
jgi:hypothetical protein